MSNTGSTKRLYREIEALAHSDGYSDGINDRRYDNFYYDLDQRAAYDQGWKQACNEVKYQPPLFTD